MGAIIAVPGFAQLALNPWEAISAVKLSSEAVEHVAELAQLALSDQEKDLFREQLSTILAYAERLRQLDTESIPPTATVLPLENVMREDEIEPSLSLADVMANAPRTEDDCFRVPVVLESDG
jgi:aspartyl-tRNA(Asn)/glutamyl-tRNA(Gln) amidotransferase subunit C